MAQGTIAWTRTTLVAAAVGLLVLAAIPPVAADPGGGERVEVIVVLADDTAAGAQGRAVARDHGVDLTHSYVHGLAGFAGSLPAARLAQLRGDARVASVEPDVWVTAAGLDEVPTGVARIGALDNAQLPIGPDAEVAGTVDATVAVLDSGIDLNHPDLDVVHEWGCVTVSTGPPRQRGTTCATGEGLGDDVTGHGTHVAGTVAASGSGQGIVGVAPGARLWSVKVLGPDGGSLSDVIAGIEHVTVHADAIDVANMSLGGAFTSDALDQAIATSVAAGVTYVFAAGNDAIDVAGYSPAGHPDGLTVAALADYDGQAGSLAAPTCSDHGPDDTLATFSNHGAGVDLIAPGVCIRSSRMGGGTSLGSGTSMAAPHVAGAAALLASTGLDTGQIHAALLAAGSADWVTATWPGTGSLPLLDVSDPDVFAPSLLEDDAAEPDPDEPEPDPGDPEPEPDPAGTAIGLVGDWSGAQGQWTSWIDVTVTEDGTPTVGATVSVTYRSERDGTLRGDRCTTGDDGTCRVVGPTLPNRDKWVAYTVTHLDAAEVEGPSLTVHRG